MISKFRFRNKNFFLSTLAAVALTQNLAFAQVTTSAVPTPPGLVSWWRGEGNALDQTGNNRGALTGKVEYGPGVVGQGFVLDGNDGSGIQVGNPTNLHLQDFTIEAWVKRGSSSIVTHHAFGNGALFTYGEAGYCFGMHDNGNIYLSAIAVNIVEVSTGIRDTNFHHLALTKSGTDVVFYVDGVAYPAPTYSYTFQFYTTAAVGMRPDDMTASFLGTIDELAIYNRPLQSSEISAIYTAGSAGKFGEAPVIVFQPTNQTTVAGNLASFSVGASGAAPLTYQWIFQGANMAGATNATLILSNLQQNQSGSYAVCVSNAFGTATSSNAQLTVFSATSGVPAPSGLVSWWRGEENTLDQTGNNIGTLVGNTTYSTGAVGKGFVLDGNNGSGVQVGNPTNLQLQNFTIETWVKRGSPSIVTHHAFGNGALFTYGEAGYCFGMHDNGNIYLSAIAVNIVEVNTAITDTNFHHVAVTKSGSTLVFYVDGVAYPAPAYTYTFQFYTTAAVGMRPDDMTASFLGIIDDLAIYNRPLQKSEIQAIYNAGSDGKRIGPSAPFIFSHPTNQTALAGTATSFSVTASGTVPLSYQWSFKGTNIDGATNSALILSNITAVQSGDYAVRVSNAFGFVLSSNANLTVNDPPSVTTPAGLVSWWRGEGNAWDQIGNNNGFLTNVTFGPGRVGQGVVFGPNINSGIDLGNPTNLQLQDFTVELWVKRSNTNRASMDTVGGTVLFGYGVNGYSIGMFDNGRINLSKTGISDVRVPGITDMNFHHIAVTKSGSTVYFYIDGVASSPQFYSTTFQFTTPAAIGKRGDLPRQGFLGTIDEVSVYNRALSTNEIYSIYRAGEQGKTVTEVAPFITQQPASCAAKPGASVSLFVGAGGSPVIKYQWLFNGAKIANSTNAVLTLTNVQQSDSGNFSVILSNPIGSITSSNAVVVVSLPPVITIQPQSQSVLAGSNVTLSVEASGSSLNYQWKFNGAAIAGATNSLFVLSDIQKTNAGVYSVTVSNPVGTEVSSEAILTVISAPEITKQPQSQSVVVGGTATFSVPGEISLPIARSGTLKLWLDAQNGVVTNSSGMVNQWQDQSENLNHASQVNTNKQPRLVNSPDFGGKAVLRFDGIQTSALGDLLQGTKDVGLTNGYTSFLVYLMRKSSNFEGVVALIGAPGGRSSARAYYYQNYQMAFGGWENDYYTGFYIPTNTCRIWTDRLNENKSAIELFDSSATTSSNYVKAVSGLLKPASGYYIGGVNLWNENFTGDIAEIIYYQGALSDADRIAVEQYLKMKYFQASSGRMSYQWLFNGTNVVGATNAVMTLTNVQMSDSGSYSVVLSNAAGITISSNAVLTVNRPPTITTPPQDQTGVAGGSLTLTVIADGSGPLSFQWQREGVAVAGATNASLVLTNLQFADAGYYQVVVSSPFGSVTSSNAMVKVMAPVLQALNASGVGGGIVSVPIQLVALGGENGVSFSLNFDASVMTFVGVDAGADIASGLLIPNTNSVSSGQLGIVLALPSGSVFPAGTRELARVRLQILPLAATMVRPITFGDEPTVQKLVDVEARNLVVSFVGGVVAITQAQFEGDVSPRTNVDYNVLVDDWVQVGRFVAGLDAINSPGEFQRADSAPRETLGNGKLTITDWVQAGRYAAGLDPLTPAGGPSSPSESAGLVAKMQRQTGVVHSVALASPSSKGATNSIYVELSAQGDENALGFSLNFDPSVLGFSGAVVGSDAQGAILNVNTNKATSGKLGFGLALAAGKTFAAGTQRLIRVDFVAVSFASNNTEVVFGDVPVWRELSDLHANALATNFSSQALTVSGLPIPVLSITNQTTNLVLSWLAESPGFVVEASTAFGTDWSSITNTPVTNDPNITVTLPAPVQMQFYRLKHQ